MTTAAASLAPARTERPQGWAMLTALGIVYGDLGTSPLYTLQTVVQAMEAASPPRARWEYCR